MAIKLPLLDRKIKIVEQGLTPSLPFHQWWQSVVRAIERALAALEDNVEAIEAALEAAGIALAAADAAQAAADSAQAIADGAGTTSKLSGSGVSGLTLQGVDSGSDASITISAHTRVYSDGTQVSVGANSLPGLAYSTVYYVYYDDPTFAGGAVSYVATTIQADAAQVNGRHLVGEVTTPAGGAPANDGLKPAVPGFGQLEP